MDDFAILGGLFAIAFVAATILPAQSEAVLVGLLVAGTHSLILLVAVASVGNILGAVFSWALGRGVERFRDRKWFPVSPASLDRATGWYRRWGRWSLLRSWAPIGGDALTVAAGVLRRAAMELRRPGDHREDGTLSRADSRHARCAGMMYLLQEVG